MIPFSYPYKLLTILTASFMLLSFVHNEQNFLTTPKAKAIPHKYELCGESFSDNYFWLRNMEDPDVLKYIRDENTYTDYNMQHIQPLQTKIYNEIKSRICENDISVPDKIGEYLYYNRTIEGKQYSLFCRKKHSMDAMEEILVDQNKLTENIDYLHIDKIKVSPDHKFVAFSIDTSGSEEFSILIKNIEYDIVIDTILLTSGNFEWANDSNSIFYTVMDDTKRAYRLYNHKPGIGVEEDKLIYEEHQKPYFVDIEKTKDEKYLLISCETLNSSEVMFIDADDSDYKIHSLIPRRENVVYSVEHRGNCFYIYTNENAENFRILEVPADSFTRNNFRELVPNRANVSIEEYDIFKDHFVLYERENGIQKVRIINLNNESSTTIDFNEPVYTIHYRKNPAFNTNILRVEYSSFSIPNTTFDYNMETCVKDIKKVTQVKSFICENYITDRIFAKTTDGVMIPISLFYKKGIKRDANNPLLLTGYGAYGINSETQFSARILSLVDRGFIYAVAHVRGGSELGRRWYEDGKLLKKTNTFYDFICSAEFLINENYTCKEKLTISGGSAGGLLIGAVLNIAPDLCKTALALVPFVDVINTMRDDSLPLTLHEYEEWGNPNEESFFKVMRGYSPYDNVKEKKYPNLLITAALYDARVPYWEPVKWAAKLRAMKKDSNLLLLKVNMDSGHGGSSGRYNYIWDTAFQYAFILDRLNITE